MNDSTERDIRSFAFNLGFIRGIAQRALREDDELLSFFVSRGVERKDLEAFLESGQKLQQAFYNNGKPA